MAKPLPQNTNILVEHIRSDNSYCMPSMEVATDHYSLSFIRSGDRKCITYLYSFTYHGDCVTLMAPYIYHQTLSTSSFPYEKIMIKFSPKFVEPFIKEFGIQLFNELYSQNVYHYSKDVLTKIRQMFVDIYEEYIKSEAHSEFILQGMLFRILKTVWQERLQAYSIKYNANPLTAPILNVLTFIENNYSSNPSVNDAAKVAGFSTAYFSRLFKKQLGKSYSEYLDDIKLHYACILLIQTNQSIMEIALKTGYCHGNYLAVKMKQKLGMSPLEYRRKGKTNST